MRPPLYPHQQREIEEHWSDAARLLPWAMRTGKSRVVVETASRLWSAGLIDRVIIIAPSRVHVAWVEEQLPEWSGVPMSLYAWQCGRAETPPAPRHDALSVLAVNIEAVRVERAHRIVTRYIRGGPTLLVVDESHHYGSPGTRGTRRVRAYALRCPYRRLLTGTLVGNSPGRVYSQMQILQPGALGCASLQEFQRRFARMRWNGRYWELVPKSWRRLDELRRRIASWGTEVTCAELPDVQARAEYVSFDLAEHDRLLEEGRQSDPPNFHPARSAVAWTPAKARALRDLARGRQVLVWAPFITTVDAVAEEMGMVGHHGGLSMAARRRALIQYQGGASMVSTPDSLAEGVDLSSASRMIWLAPPWDVVVYEQASARCTRIGEEPPDVVRLVTSGSLEVVMYRALARKRSVAEELAP